MIAERATAGPSNQYTDGVQLSKKCQHHRADVYDFSLNGATAAYSDSQVSKVVVNGLSGGFNTANVLTNDQYQGADGLMHETSEAVTIGDGGASVQKLDAAGNATDFLSLSGFQTVFAVAGNTDEGFIAGTPGISNVFVGAGGYAYMNSGADFYYLKGAKYVYSYALSANDYAYQYDGSDASAYVVSGTAYSLMLGTDGGHSFFNEAVGFKFNEGIAQHPGDTAYFYDSPGNDFFTGYSRYSSLASADGSFVETDVAAYFSQVYAYSFVGGNDAAVVYDYTVNHVLGFKGV